MGDLTKISDIAAGSPGGENKSEKTSENVPEKLEKICVPVIPEIQETGEIPGFSESGEIAELREKLAELEKRHAREISSLKAENAAALEIYKSGAKNVKAVRSLIALAEPLELTPGGEVAGLSEAIAQLKKSDPYLFEDDRGLKLSGAVPAESSGELPDFSKMTYSQISEFLRKNPQFAVEE